MNASLSMKPNGGLCVVNRIVFFVIASFGVASCGMCNAQDANVDAGGENEQERDGRATIIIQTPGEIPEPPVLYTAIAKATVQVTSNRVEQAVELTVKVIQGTAKTLRFGLSGDDTVVDVQDPNLKSWSIRREGVARFLDLEVLENAVELNPVITIRSNELSLPASIDLTHLSPGDAIGFDSVIAIHYETGITGTVTSVDGFIPIDANRRTNRFQTSTGGKISLALNRDGGAPGPVEFIDTTLTGELHSDGRSISFQLRGTARVTEVDAEIAILSGDAAVHQVPADESYRLRLAIDNERPVYKLAFARAGTFPVLLDFVANVRTPEANWKSIDFTIAASAVVPVTLHGLEGNLEYQRDGQSVVPLPDGDAWVGFLPATGTAKLQWKAARNAGEGRLFFTATSRIDTRLGVGLLRQEHEIDYQVLQGELTSSSIRINGPGEILDVQGSNIVAWNVTDRGEQRQLDATLSQPITGSGQIRVRSQTPLDGFPVRVEGMTLSPVGSVRHSGHLRLTNLGSVRLEPTGLSGLNQLAPEQFPGDPIEARQVFVYRFPSSDYAFSVAADRIKPEISVSQVVLYQLSETDRVIQADIELDIREAPIRDFDLGIPADYSVVAVTGATVADYVTATEVASGVRSLKVVFGEDVAGRQLVNLHLEKSEAASAQAWILPRLDFPDAKTVRGNIGVIGAPGFRSAVGQTDLLVETPLSYFPKPTANLQQAFRIREPGWSATMQIELLDRSVQSDAFHLYSLSQETVFGSVLINYLVTGAPVSEWRITVPAALLNVMVNGQDIRTWRREDDTLVVSLHQPVMGPYTLLVTFEEKPDLNDGTFHAGQVVPLGVQGERGYIQVVSPMQVELSTLSASEDMLTLDPLELPAEFRLLSTAPPLGTWQYTVRPFVLSLRVNWFEPGTTVAQVVEFSEANSRVSQDGELVTDVLYYVKSRGQRSLRIRLPAEPVRLWEVTVNGQPVTARQTDNTTLIGLPGGTDPNVPVEVRLRLGKPTVSESYPMLTLPTIDAPVLETQWNIVGDEKCVLVPSGGTVKPSLPVLRPTGFAWVAKRGFVTLILIVILVGFGIWACDKPTEVWRGLGLVGLVVSIVAAVVTALVAFSEVGLLAPLELSLPVLAAGEFVELQVHNISLWRVNLSWLGLTLILAGIAAIAWSLSKETAWRATMFRGGGILLIAFGVLLQRDGAGWFFGLLAATILLAVLAPRALDWSRGIRQILQSLREKRRATKNAKLASTGTEPGAVTASAVLIAALLSSIGSPCSAQQLSTGFKSADSITQQWHVTHADARLTASCTVTLSGHRGDRFVLLKSPAVLTRFDGDGLRLTKLDVAGHGLAYVVSIPAANDSPAADASQNAADRGDVTSVATEVKHEATFEFQLESITPTGGVPVLTGNAAVQEIQLHYDQSGWEMNGPTVVRAEPIESAAGTTQVRILLGPGTGPLGTGTLVFQPMKRDVRTEPTQFFVEAFNLYLPGPGVIDGRHRLHIRTSQGQLSELEVLVPKGLTVSAVGGPVGSWQFDADSGKLEMEIEPPQSQTFDVTIDTQRGLDPLPVDVNLSPLSVAGANGEVGLVGIAFGPDAQPERAEATGMSAVNLGDFDSGLVGDSQAVLHRVYRYGAGGGVVALRVAPVVSEVRVLSKQVLSLGDERTVLSVNFAAEITRSGLFQLSFPLPDGLEVESLSGDSLHHWAELSEGDQRQIILHLNGKTIGPQDFSLVLAGPSPAEVGDWTIARFELNEANRQSGELVVRPTTGIRLRTASRQNVSETDPRAIGGGAPGALAFRLLQRDWSLVLGIEKLDPWVTGQVLHDVTVREGQTRSSLTADFNVQNASIRTLQVVLPINDEDEIKTLRATGDTVSDVVRTRPDSNIWEVQFKRRIVGNARVHIEYERRGDRADDIEVLQPAEFPQARLLAYFFSVRAGGRLEIEPDTFPQGWQQSDWNAVPQPLRDAGDRNAPTLALRAVTPQDVLVIRVKRHSLADALKLRVAQGELSTILSPTGDQLTAVDVTVEVMQRSSMSIVLPADGELFSVFVNGESVHSIRRGDNANRWQFYILPGMDDRTASLRFVYSVRGDRLSRIQLVSPQMSVPLENIQWHVVAPIGFELTDHDGNLELTGQTNQQKYDRHSYLSKISAKRKTQAQQATQLLEQANQLLQAGEQTKARWALNSVANQYALDAASNEDARVQLENLQTQQAIVGLNTRRQRLYLDSGGSEAVLLGNEQFRQAAADNPILQQNQLNFRPQELSQLLRGNTTEDNAVLQQIAASLVQHQRTTEPAPQAIIISLPEQGAIYTFRRSVQVTENAPLELDLRFGSEFRILPWQWLLSLLLLSCLAATLAIVPIRRAAAASVTQSEVPNAEAY